LYCTLTDSIVRHCCSGAVSNLYNFVRKLWKLQICFI
jgi:hypothetical protein